jgi:hypothetical protein
MIGASSRKQKPTLLSSTLFAYDAKAVQACKQTSNHFACFVVVVGAGLQAVLCLYMFTVAMFACLGRVLSPGSGGLQGGTGARTPCREPRGSQAVFQPGSLLHQAGRLPGGRQGGCILS